MRSNSYYPKILVSNSIFSSSHTLSFFNSVFSKSFIIRLVPLLSLSSIINYIGKCDNF